jgi:hypothetical protein
MAPSSPDGRQAMAPTKTMLRCTVGEALLQPERCRHSGGDPDASVP